MKTKFLVVILSLSFMLFFAKKAKKDYVYLTTQGEYKITKWNYLADSLEEIDFNTPVPIGRMWSAQKHKLYVIAQHRSDYSRQECLLLEYDEKKKEVLRTLSLHNYGIQRVMFLAINEKYNEIWLTCWSPVTDQSGQLIDMDFHLGVVSLKNFLPRLVQTSDTMYENLAFSLDFEKVYLTVFQKRLNGQRYHWNELEIRHCKTLALVKPPVIMGQEGAGTGYIQGPVDNKMVLLNRMIGEIVVLDLNSDSIVNRKLLGGYMMFCQVDPLRKRIYLPREYPNEGLQVYSLATLDLIDTMPMNYSYQTIGSSVVMSPKFDYLIHYHNYPDSSNQYISDIELINPETLTVETSIPYFKAGYRLFGWMSGPYNKNK